MQVVHEHNAFTPQKQAEELCNRIPIDTLTDCTPQAKTAQFRHKPSGGSSLKTAQKPQNANLAITYQIRVPQDRNHQFERKTKESGDRGVSRYKLLRIAQGIAAGTDRLKLCQTRITPGPDARKGIQVRRNRQTGHYSYGNLFCCGNVWGCAVCSSRIAQQRAADVEEAMSKHVLMGGVCDMHTYTFRHHYGDDLQQINGAMKRALRRLKSGRWFQQFRWNILGSINGSEVTHGGNGFHPHVHEVLFLQRSWTTDEECMWRARWMECLEMEGLQANDNGFHCAHAVKPSGYIAKLGVECSWGADQELVSTSKKTGRNEWDGLSQWQILERAEGDTHYEHLWKIYVDAFRGRRRLTWTRGLKARFGIAETEDVSQEVVEDVQTLTREEFRKIWTRGDESMYLDLVATMGPELAHFTYFQTMSRDHLTLPRGHIILHRQ